MISKEIRKIAEDINTDEINPFTGRPWPNPPKNAPNGDGVPNISGIKIVPTKYGWKVPLAEMPSTAQKAALEKWLNSLGTENWQDLDYRKEGVLKRVKFLVGDEFWVSVKPLESDYYVVEDEENSKERGPDYVWDSLESIFTRGS